MRWSVSSQICCYYLCRVVYWDDGLEFGSHSEWFLLRVTDICVLVTDDWLPLYPMLHLYLMPFIQNTVDDSLTCQRPSTDPRTIQFLKYRRFCCFSCWYFKLIFNERLQNEKVKGWQGKPNYEMSTKTYARTYSTFTADLIVEEILAQVMFTEEDLIVKCNAAFHPFRASCLLQKLLPARIMQGVFKLFIPNFHEWNFQWQSFTVV